MEPFAVEVREFRQGKEDIPALVNLGGSRGMSRITFSGSSLKVSLRSYRWRTALALLLSTPSPRGLTVL